MGTPEWPGDTPYSCGWTASISDGSAVNLSTMTTSPHVGTHADAPVHVRDGWPGAHELPLDAFYGPAVVIDISNASGELSFADIEPAISGLALERLPSRPGQASPGSISESWPTISESCARTPWSGASASWRRCALGRRQGKQVTPRPQHVVLRECVHSREPRPSSHPAGSL